MSEFPFLNDDDFSSFFLLPFKVLRDTKLQTFQYKLINRIIPCGVALQSWNLKASDTCQLCDAHDSLSHYFYDCPMTNAFWTNVINWTKNRTNTYLPLSKVDILFWVPLYDRFMLCLNFIILHGKWHLFRCKLNSDQPSFLDYLVELKNELNTERYISAVNGEISQFEEKWGIFYEELF